MFPLKLSSSIPHNHLSNFKENGKSFFPESKETIAVNPQNWHGPLYAVLAYGTWGLLPLYWKLFLGVPALEVLVHRILWSVIFMLIMVIFLKKLSLLIEFLKKPKQLFIMLMTSMLLGVNWIIYIWAVNEGFILEASLGYFINPLLNILFGMIVFKERFNV